MDDHKKYLAERLFSEDLPVTYGLLSKIVNIHVNTAKKVLFDFYQYQNALHANSIHATYLVYGTKVEDVGPKGDDDAEIESQLPKSHGLSDYAPTHTLALVAEEDLKNTLAGFNSVSAMHIYSLAPHPQRDLIPLVEVSKPLPKYRSREEVSEEARKLDVISNPLARKKDRKDHTSCISASSPMIKAAAVAKLGLTSSIGTKQDAAVPSSTDSALQSSSNKKLSPSLKRGDSSSIMQSFAKAAAKPPTSKPAIKHQEDAAMILSDDGEADDTDLPPPKKVIGHSEEAKKSRKEREDELRRMMDNFEDEDDKVKNEDSDLDDEEIEDEAEPEPEPESCSNQEKELIEMVSSTRDGRRRGKRRIMRKNRMLDDQGYMITIQEAAWESFSEEESQALNTKTAQASSSSTPSSTPNSTAVQKPKKSAARGSNNQGSIMSFFAKK